MQGIRKILERLIPQNPKVVHLGRWKIEYCDRKMKQKVELSNEDHCGPCGNFMLNKQIENKVENPKV